METLELHFQSCGLSWSSGPQMHYEKYRKAMEMSMESAPSWKHLPMKVGFIVCWLVTHRFKAYCWFNSDGNVLFLSSWPLHDFSNEFWDCYSMLNLGVAEWQAEVVCALVCIRAPGYSNKVALPLEMERIEPKVVPPGDPVEINCSLAFILPKLKIVLISSSRQSCFRSWDLI